MSDHAGELWCPREPRAGRAAPVFVLRLARPADAARGLPEMWVVLAGGKETEVSVGAFAPCRCDANGCDPGSHADCPWQDDQ